MWSKEDSPFFSTKQAAWRIFKSLTHEQRMKKKSFTYSSKAANWKYPPGVGVRLELESCAQPRHTLIPTGKALKPPLTPVPTRSFLWACAWASLATFRPENVFTSVGLGCGGQGWRWEKLFCSHLNSGLAQILGGNQNSLEKAPALH